MPQKISSILEENIAYLTELFRNDPTVKHHRFQPIKAAGLRCCIFFVDGLVDSIRINESIIQPVSTLCVSVPENTDAIDFLCQQVLQVNETEKADCMDSALRPLLYGDTVLFVEGSSKALVLGSKGFSKRGISEPAGETYLKGPREGFTEPLLLNLALLRRRLRTTALKFETFTLGSTTKTECCMCYLTDAVDRKALALLHRRLSKIVIDGIFDTNYISELIRDQPYSPFRTTGSSERPDVVASRLLEGRIALLVDGSPMALTVPCVFIEQFQSGEDYYVDASFAAINRMLRFVGFITAVGILPLYLSLVTFHQAFMPLPLILSIAEARQGVPFPILMEALFLLLAFDMLREAGSRTPAGIGQALSVVGGLVIGQAAVEARLVSVPVLIIVAVSGICSLITPRLKAAILFSRLLLLLLGVAFGVYGVLLGWVAIILFLSGHRSFDVPFLSFVPIDSKGSGEDSLIRTPFRLMKKFRRFLAKVQYGR